jgi:guanylate kinase
MQNKKGKLVVISGFSGAGKGTTVKYLIDHFDNYALSISATSRNKRPGEEDGTHYFFISKSEFEELISNDDLLEYTKYSDNYYGTPKGFVDEKLKSGQNVLLEIEINGAMNVKAKFNEAILIFLTAPSYQDLISRLKNRNTETDEQIKSRLKIALNEASGASRYDYVIINHDVGESASIINDIISDNVDTINKVNSDRKKVLDIIDEIKDSIEKFVK